MRCSSDFLVGGWMMCECTQAEIQNLDLARLQHRAPNRHSKGGAAPGLDFRMTPWRRRRNLLRRRTDFAASPGLSTSRGRLPRRLGAADSSMGGR